MLLRPPPWTAQAACAGKVTPDRDCWHPHDDLPADAKAFEFAVGRRVCADCPVRLSCALEALQGAIGHGMYGGLTPTDRRRVARQYGYPQPSAAAHGSRSRYVAGCRCADCTEAHRRWAEGRRAAGAWTRTPPAPRPSRALDPQTKVLQAVKAADGQVTARAVYRATGVKAARVRAIVAAAEASGDLPAGLVA